jgi:hypothetical protein
MDFNMAMVSMRKYKKGRDQYFDKLKRLAARYFKDVGKFLNINSKEAKAKARPETELSPKILQKTTQGGIEKFIKVQKPRKKGKASKKSSKKGKQ